MSSGFTHAITSELVCSVKRGARMNWNYLNFCNVPASASDSMDVYPLVNLLRIHTRTFNAYLTEY